MPTHAKSGFYRSLILKLMKPMTEGRLMLELPDGEKVSFGSGSHGIHAQARIVRDDFFKKCALFGDVGFGEAYVDGDWETPDIAAVIAWMILNVENHPSLMHDRPRRKRIDLLGVINKFYHAARVNTVSGSRKNISAHYDLSNDFFKTFLDRSMTYSSAYFEKQGMDLEAAQTEKYDRLARKLCLRPGDRVLEIGCGWGGFAVHAAKRYGAHVTGLTISAEQYRYAEQRFNEEGISDRAVVKLEDYRHTKGRYDKIVSIEMLEAVGHRYFEAFFGQCHRLLKHDGLLGLQVILCPDHRYQTYRRSVDWIQKHIFPGGLLPSFAVLHGAVNRTGDLALLDYEDMTPHYAETLLRWRERLNGSRESVLGMGFDEALLRKWNYYFAYCQAAFKMRNISVAQMIYTRPNNHGLGRAV